MTSRSHFVRIAVVAGALFVATSSWTPAIAQQAEAKPVPPPPLPTIPVKVDVTLARYQGEKKMSSLPFSLYASAGPRMGGQVSMRMGVDVPVGTSTTTETRTVPSGQSTNSTGATSTRVEYRSVGTNIDTYVIRTDDSRFAVYVNVNDSSIYTADGDAKNLKIADAAAFRTFSTSNTVTLRDGQTVQFGMGTDKVSGEVLKIEVTLTVIK